VKGRYPDPVVRAPTVDEVAEVLRSSGQGQRPDRSYEAFMQVTGSSPDLSDPAHRAALLVWLNAWGCRIRCPRAGEASPFDDSVADWWARWRRRLPHHRARLATVTDRHIDAVAAAYGDLCERPVASTGRGAARRLGPTAAAKTLYVIRPRAVVPWDAAIAAGLHGDRSPRAFARHQEVGRAWAVALLAESGLREDRLVAGLGRPGSSLARLIDEYQYVTITRGGRLADEVTAP
jgi:hypothetical protein